MMDSSNIFFCWIGGLWLKIDNFVPPDIKHTVSKNALNSLEIVIFCYKKHICRKSAFKSPLRARARVCWFYIFFVFHQITFRWFKLNHVLFTSYFFEKSFFADEYEYSTSTIIHKQYDKYWKYENYVESTINIAVR